MACHLLLRDHSPIQGHEVNLAVTGRTNTGEKHLERERGTGGEAEREGGRGSAGERERETERERERIDGDEL